jgi:hypothetical protein
MHARCSGARFTPTPIGNRGRARPPGRPLGAPCLGPMGNSTPRPTCRQLRRVTGAPARCRPPRPPLGVYRNKPLAFQFGAALQGTRASRAGAPLPKARNGCATGCWLAKPTCGRGEVRRAPTLRHGPHARIKASWLCDRPGATCVCDPRPEEGKKRSRGHGTAGNGVMTATSTRASGAMRSLIRSRV